LGAESKEIQALAVMRIQRVSWLRAAAALAAWTIAAGVTSAAQIPSIEGRMVTAVRVVTERGQVLEQNPKNLSLVAGKPYRTDAERNALKQLFATGLYSAISTEATPEAEGVRIDFVVAQNYFFGVQRVEGLKEPPNEARALAAMGLELGHTYTKSAMDEALRGLKEALADDGLYQATLSVQLDRMTATRLVNVTVVVKPGRRARFGAITFINHSPFNSHELQERTKLHSGQPVTAERISSGVDRLRQYLVKKNYLTARVDAARGDYEPQPNAVPLSVHVEAGPEVRVTVEGARVGGKQLKKLIPIYQEGAVDPDLLEEGRRNLRNYFERKGYFNSKVSFLTREAEEGKQERIVYNVERGTKSRLVRVIFKGNHYFSSELLTSRLTIQPASFLSPGRFSPRLLEGDVDSIRGIYLASGFRDASVKANVEDDYEGKKNNLLVEFLIAEGPQTKVESLAIHGNQAIPTNQLFDVIGSTPGQPYSAANISNDRDNLLALYYNSGFPDATFAYQAKHVAPNQMALDYTIHEGPQVIVKHVLVVGYRHTRPGVIRREVQIQPGQPLREADIVSTQDRLYNLGIFNRVDIATENPNGSLEEKNVVINTREGDRYTIGYGGGLEAQRIGSTTSATSTALQFSPLGIFDFSKLNMFGRAQTLSFKVRASTLQYRGLLSYQIPNLLTNHRFNLLLTGFADKIRNVNTFTGTTYEGSLQVLENYSRGSTLLYRYTFRHVLVDASSLKINPEQIPLFSQPTRVSGFGLTWVRDRRNNPAEATRGSYNTADVSFYSKALGSSASFLRVFVQNTTYTPFGHIFVFARSTRFGVEEPVSGTVADQIPLPERFFAGGGNSLRGFALNQAGPRDPVTGFPVGGLAELIFNQEIRFPMRLPLVGTALGGALFYDAGNVYSSFSNITLASTPASPTELNFFSHTVGLGIRYLTPVGPVRFDLGYLLNPAKFQTTCTTGTPGCTNGVQLSRLPRLQFFFNIGSVF
jgi:outer membrane protein assembly complex protein YaeT